jgi:hypothetical protein
MEIYLSYEESEQLWPQVDLALLDKHLENPDKGPMKYRIVHRMVNISRSNNVKPNVRDQARQALERDGYGEVRELDGKLYVGIPKRAGSLPSLRKYEGKVVYIEVPTVWHR